MKVHRGLITLLLLAVCAFCSDGYGDGMYFPPSVVEDLPKMPRQQGLIVWHDGTEELVVQSDMDGAGKTLAWVVPVPAEPTKIEPVAPGVLATLNWGIQPALIREPPRFFFIVLFCFLWCFFLMLYNRFAPFRSLFWALIVWPPIYFPFSPAGTMLGKAGLPVATETSIEVVRVESVGNYHVEVVRAKDAAGLSDWLEQNGFHGLTPKGRDIVQQYISEGWVFAAAKLQREGEGYARPHPLSITFPASQPIYPMRLTQLANTNLLLNLYVIAPERAAAPGMETLFCDRYSLKEHGGNFSDVGVTEAQFSRQDLALPWLVEHMGERCVLTQLRARIKPKSMDRDIKLGFTPFEPTRWSVYLPEGLSYVVLGWGMSLFSLILWPYLIFHHWRPRESRREGGRFLAAVVAGCFAALVMFCASAILSCATAIKKQPVWDNVLSFRSTAYDFRHSPEELGKLTRKDIECFFGKALSQTIDPLTNAPLQSGQGPGQYEILEDERGIFVRYYLDRSRQTVIGEPMDITLVEGRRETVSGQGSGDASQ